MLVSNNIQITSGDSVNVNVGTNAPNGVEITQGQTTNLSISNVKSVGKSDANYVHNQTVSTTTWEVNHGLNKFPSVTVIDSSDRTVVGEVEYIDLNNVTLTFKAAFKGKAFFN